jgi:hypothetical protein
MSPLVHPPDELIARHEDWSCITITGWKREKRRRELLRKR